MRALLVSAVVAFAMVGSAGASAAATNHAAIIVMDAHATTQTRCVPFSGKTTNGADLIQRAGLSLLVDRQAEGTAVCSINGTGCPSNNCFCKHPVFWGYWTRDAGATSWTFSELGAALRTIHNGDADAWSWGRNGKPAPAASIKFDDVCGPHASTATTSSPQAAGEQGSSHPPNVLHILILVVVLGVLGVLALTLRRRRTLPLPD